MSSQLSYVVVPIIVLHEDALLQSALVPQLLFIMSIAAIASINPKAVPVDESVLVPDELNALKVYKSASYATP